MAATTSGQSDLNIEHLVNQLRQGDAIFSTNRGQFPARRSTLSTPFILRSDPFEDADAIILDLRSRFPEECNKIAAPINNIYDYFDQHDVHMHGTTFVIYVLNQMANENERRMKHIQDFATHWMENHIDGFPDLLLLSLDVFTADEKEKYNERFLYNTLELLRAFQEGSGRPRLEVQTSNLRDSSVASSFKTNPFEGQTVVPPQLNLSLSASATDLTSPVMIDQMHTKRRNSATLTSGGMKETNVPSLPTSDRPKTKARIPLTSEMHTPTAVGPPQTAQGVPATTVTKPDVGFVVSEQLNISQEAVEPFPPYFLTHSSDILHPAFAPLPRSHSTGPLPYLNGTPRRLSQVPNVNSLSISTHQTPNQYSFRPLPYMNQRVNQGPTGQIQHKTTSMQGPYPVYSSDPAHLLPRDPSNGLLSPIPPTHMYPYLLPGTYPAQGGQLPQQQLHSYQGFMAQGPYFPNNNTPEHGVAPLFVPKVRNEQQIRNYHPGRNPQNLHTQIAPIDRNRPHHGHLQNQSASRQNPRKSFSDDARRIPVVDTVGQRPFSGEYYANRRISSGEFDEPHRTHNSIQQQARGIRRGSGSRGGSRRSSISQNTPPNRDSYSHFEHYNRGGEYGGYITIGPQIPGRVEPSPLMHQTIEEHRSDSGHPEDGPSTDKIVIDSHETQRVSLSQGMKGVELQGAGASRSPQQAEATGTESTLAGVTTEQSRAAKKVNAQSTVTSRNTGDTDTPRLRVASLPLPDSVYTEWRRNFYQAENRPRDPLKLWVLASGTTVDDIKRLFRGFGEVLNVCGPFNGKFQQTSEHVPKPFYFVLFSKAEEAAAALEHLNGTRVNPDAEPIRVSFAFVREWELDESKTISPGTRSLQRVGEAPRPEQYGSNISQYRAKTQINTDRSLRTTSDFQNAQTMVQKPDGDRGKQTVLDFSAGIGTENKPAWQQTRNSGNPKTPKSKKGKKKSAPSTPLKQESSNELHSQLEDGQNKVPKLLTLEQRSELKEVPLNADSTKKATAELKQPDVTDTSKHAQPVTKTEHATNRKDSPKSKASGKEDIIFSNLHAKGPSKQGAKLDHTHLNISDGSPSRKPRNNGSSRKPNNSSPIPDTDVKMAKIDPPPVVPALTEDQWPALQRSAPSATETQRSPIDTKRISRRLSSIRIGSDTKAEIADVKKIAKDQGKVETKPNQATTDDAISFKDVNYAVAATLDPKNTSIHLDTQPDSTTTGNSATKSGVDLRVEVSTAPTSDSHINNPSPGGHKFADPTPYFLTQVADSWAEESDKQDAERQCALENRKPTAGEQGKQIEDKSEQVLVPDSTTGDSETQKTEEAPVLDPVPAITEGKARSSSPVVFDQANVSDIVEQDNVLAPIIAAKAASILAMLENNTDGGFDGGDLPAGHTIIQSSSAKSDESIKLIPPAKGKHKVLTIKVPPRTPSPTATESAVPLLSDSPKTAKFKQRVEEPIRSSSLSVPSPPIPTHMKKKNKKSPTPTKKIARGKQPGEITPESQRVPSDGSEHTAFDGSSMDGSAIEPLTFPEEVKRQNLSESINLTPAEPSSAATDISREDIQQSPGEEPEVENPSLARSYPAPDPSSAVYVAGDLPLVRVPAHKRTDRPSSDIVIIPTPPSSPDILTKKDRGNAKKAKKAKKRGLKADYQRHNTFQPNSGKRAESSPSLLNMASFGSSEGRESSTLGTDMPPPSAPVTSGAPSASSPSILDNSTMGTNVWRRGDSGSLFEKSLINENPVFRAENLHYPDKIADEYHQEKGGYMHKVTGSTNHLGYDGFEEDGTNSKDTTMGKTHNMRSEGLGIDNGHTSESLESSYDDFKSNVLRSNTLSTRSSIAESTSLSYLTRDSSITSTTSRLIFRDVPYQKPDGVLGFHLPIVKQTHYKNFDADGLETVNLKAAPPPSQAVSETKSLQAPETIVATPPRSPPAPEFGSGSISSKFEPDVVKEDLDSDRTAPRRSPKKPSPVMIIYQLNTPDRHLETPKSPPKRPHFEAIDYQKPAEDMISQPESPRSRGVIPQPVSPQPMVATEAVEPHADLPDPSLPLPPPQDTPHPAPSSPPKLSEANIAAHTVATGAAAAKGPSHTRNESMSEWSTTSSARRKIHREAATERPLSPRKRGQSIMSPAQSEADFVTRKKVKPHPKREDAALWALPRKERPWTSGDE
ncbi:mucin 17, cell surface associated [Lambiella insularis]|nr:mucin 17, cell surface associated [Lambiella insularis]